VFYDQSIWNFNSVDTACLDTVDQRIEVAPMPLGRTHSLKEGIVNIISILPR
jgi:hypothetical protein